MATTQVRVAGPAAASAGRWPRTLKALKPLDSGPQEIRSLDGLRALAALSVLVYHAFASLGTVTVIFGFDATFLWFYTESGVHLFFVLSGFLLFMPYARALLAAQPLPSALQFYRRRALRILPAYWVCLAILVAVNLPAYLSTVGLKNVAVHAVLLHDDFPPLNRTIQGPFWTLAVEAQFYLLLPLIALLIAKVAGSSGSLRRLLAGVVGFIVLQLAWREGVAVLAARLPSMPHALARVVGPALDVLDGGQGKFLEVFGVGMLCSVLYVAASERQLFAPRALRRAGLALLCGALATYVVLAPVVVTKRNSILAPAPENMAPRALETVFGPFWIGLGYGALLLGVLWGPRLVHGAFELGLLRFIGLISYSLYLWHDPLLGWILPHVHMPNLGLQAAAALAVGVFVAIPVAYLSYQLVERPFLRRRARATKGAAPVGVPSLAP